MAPRLMVTGIKYNKNTEATMKWYNDVTTKSGVFKKDARIFKTKNTHLFIVDLDTLNTFTLSLFFGPYCYGDVEVFVIDWTQNDNNGEGRTALDYIYWILNYLNNDSDTYYMDVEDPSGLSYNDLYTLLGRFI